MGDGQRGGQGSTEAIARRFFDFLKDVLHGMLGLEAISGQGEGRRGPQFYRIPAAPVSAGGILERFGTIIDEAVRIF